MAEGYCGIFPVFCIADPLGGELPGPRFYYEFFVPLGRPKPIDEYIELKRGAKRIVGLFLLTITLAVSAHSVLHMPPVLGMMTGLGLLQFFGFFLGKTLPSSLAKKRAEAEQNNDKERLTYLGSVVPFDVFNRVAKAEWDTLLFFYGVVTCVGGLGFIGYLSVVSELLYIQQDHTFDNIAIGFLSAVIDNIPVMFAVLSMEPDMALGQWAGVGGSLLSIGSAAGVALMGQARGIYTFGAHLKWTPVIALEYGASILTHLWVNGAIF